MVHQGSSRFDIDGYIDIIGDGKKHENPGSLRLPMMSLQCMYDSVCTIHLQIYDDSATDEKDSPCGTMNSPNASLVQYGPTSSMVAPCHNRGQSLGQSNR